MAYKLDLGFDDAFDYEKELKRTDISDSYRKGLENELKKKNEYEAKNAPKVKEYADRPQPKTVTLGNDYTLYDNKGNVQPPEYADGPEYTKAMSLTQAYIDKINAGKTSFSNSLKGIINQIRNRQNFSYDFNADPLFQQTLNSSMMSGQVAMQDSIGQASALTGGYGSTYATAVGNNIYNQYVQGAYDQIPDFYNMALNQYQIEGDNLYREYSMLAEQDASEYARLLDAYNVNFNNATYLDERDYNRYRDSVNDARYEDETAYNREWNEKQWEYQREQDAIANERYEAQWEHDLEREALEDERYTTESQKDDERWEWQKGMSEAELQYQKEQGYIKNQQYINENDWNGDKKVDVNDSIMQSLMTGANSSGSKGNFVTVTYKDNNGKIQTGEVDIDALAPYIKETAKYSTTQGRENYWAGLSSTGLIGEAELAYLSDVYSLPPLEYRSWTMTHDGGDNGGGGIDEDARVMDENGNEYTLKNLHSMLVEEYLQEDDALSIEGAKNKATEYILTLQANKGATYK